MCNLASRDTYIKFRFKDDSNQLRDIAETFHLSSDQDNFHVGGGKIEMRDAYCG